MDPLSSETSESKQVVLVVLDGWGMAPPGKGNAIETAKTPNMDSLWSSFPHSQLSASGEAVGLPRGEVGNTETGHLNLGAGKIVYQDLARINMSIADGSFFNNPYLSAAAGHVSKNNSSFHLIGLIGAGGVHSNIEHLFALIQFAARQQIQNLYLHLITDGRDSPPTSSKMYISQIRKILQTEHVGKFASVMGRYWAMDRDKRWDRTTKAYKCLTAGEGNLYKTPEEAIEDSYHTGKTDEFVEPSLMTSPDGKPVALIKENDAVVFFNFRVDRPRQLSRLFVFDKEEDITGIDLAKDRSVVKRVENTNPISVGRGEKIKNLYFTTMTEYEKSLTAAGTKVLFPPSVVDLPLGAVIAHQNMKQLRAAESEKERFVTYYFNGERELIYPGEDHLIVPSPKVATYDLKPEMSAYELTDGIIKKMSETIYPFVLVNFANVDMVGHTGNFDSAVMAVESLDKCIGKLAKFILSYGGTLVITADHGNAEEMINLKNGEPITEHSGNPVPFIVVSSKYQFHPEMLPSGILGDVAPTVLGLLGIEIPSSMIGRDLLSDLSRQH